VAKKRGAIQMTEAELWPFIESHKSLQVVTLNKDGSPHLTTLWFAIVDGAIVFETFSKSQKIVNLRRDPRIAVLVEDGETYDQLRGVSINGKAELVDGADKVHKLAFAVMKKMNPQVPTDALEKMALQMAQKRTAVIVRPEKIVSWDHRKLGGVY
jgi:PPOX class probable F420-dependent enzyme